MVYILNKGLFLPNTCKTIVSIYGTDEYDSVLKCTVQFMAYMHVLKGLDIVNLTYKYILTANQ
jgi:hypothetical protein